MPFKPLGGETDACELTDHALSAAYLLASAARQIIIPEHGRAGSIGVVTLHADLSGALEQRGIKVSVLRAGTQKMAANPFEPLADDTIQRLLGDLEAARTTFAESVGRYRGTRLTSQAALTTEAQDYRGVRPSHSGSPTPPAMRLMHLTVSSERSRQRSKEHRRSYTGTGRTRPNAFDPHLN